MKESLTVIPIILLIIVMSAARTEHKKQLAAILAALVLTAGTAVLNSHLDRRALVHEIAALERQVDTLRQQTALMVQDTAQLMAHAAMVEIEIPGCPYEFAAAVAWNLREAGHHVVVDFGGGE